MLRKPFFCRQTLSSQCIPDVFQNSFSEKCIAPSAIFTEYTLRENNLFVETYIVNKGRLSLVFGFYDQYEKLISIIHSQTDAPSVPLYLSNYGSRFYTICCSRDGDGAGSGHSIECWHNIGNECRNATKVFKKSEN